MQHNISRVRIFSPLLVLCLRPTRGLSFSFAFDPFFPTPIAYKHTIPPAAVRFPPDASFNNINRARVYYNRAASGKRHRRVAAVRVAGLSAKLS